MEPLSYEMDLTAARDWVWQVLTTPDGIYRWLGHRAIVEPVIGGPFELFLTEDITETTQAVALIGQVYSIDKPRLLHLGSGDPQNPHEVKIELFPTPQGTRLKVTHLGFGDSPADAQTRQRFNRAWMNALEKLRVVAGI
jgi:uncharacterized protein YndB with AHSA1/START domain